MKVQAETAAEAVLVSLFLIQHFELFCCHACLQPVCVWEIFSHFFTLCNEKRAYTHRTHTQSQCIEMHLIIIVMISSAENNYWKGFGE